MFEELSKLVKGAYVIEGGQEFYFSMGLSLGIRLERADHDKNYRFINGRGDIVEGRIERVVTTPLQRKPLIKISFGEFIIIGS